MNKIKYFLMIATAVISLGYQHYRLSELQKDYNTFKTETALQEKVYENKISNLINTAKEQNNQISALNVYINETKNNNNDTNEIVNEYHKLIPTAKNITIFQNKLFDDFGRD